MRGGRQEEELRRIIMKNDRVDRHKQRKTQSHFCKKIESILLNLEGGTARIIHLHTLVSISPLRNLSEQEGEIKGEK